jgi:hypothetical protein
MIIGHIFVRRAQRGHGTQNNKRKGGIQDEQKV